MRNESTGVMIVLSSPAPGTSEQEFDDWYTHVHVPEILTEIDGVRSVRRFRLHPETTPPGAPVHTHLAVYDLTDDPAKVRERITNRPRSTGAMPTNTSTHPPLTLMYEAITDVISA